MASTARLTALLLLGLLTLLGCGEQEAADADYKASIGSNARTAVTDALGIAVVVDGAGNGRVVGTLLNTGEEPQSLVGASVRTERGPATATLVEGPLELPPGQAVQLAREPAVSVSAVDLPVGLFVDLTLELEGGEPVELLVPVEAQEGPYADIEVTAPPDGDVAPD